MRYLAKTINYTPGETVRLALFGDVHDGSAYFARRHFKKFLSEAMDHPNAYLIGMGDHVDALVPSDAKRFQISTIDPLFLSGSNPDEILTAQADDFIKLVAPYQSKILGLCTGNHEVAVSKRHGFNIHRYICDKLDCENLGYSFLLLLKLTDPNHRRTRSVTIFGVHGAGGGSRTEGGPITKYARLISYYDADLYITAHDHDYFIKKIARLGVNNAGNMQSRDIVLCNTGSFAKTLSDGDTPSWAETRLMPPRLLGGIILEIKPDNNGWVDITAVQ